MAQQANFKRRIYLIDRGFQYAYIWRILALELVAVVTTSLVMSYLFLFIFNDDTLVSAGPWGTGILYSTLLLIIILVGILFWLGIRVSHRIAGPMYRFGQSFRQVEDGNLSVRVYLRERDEMKPIAAAFNSMMDKLEKQIEQSSPCAEAPTVDSRLSEIKQLIGDSEMEAADKDKYRKIVDGLREKLS